MSDIDEQVWSRMRKSLREELPGHVFQAYVDPVACRREDADSLDLICPDVFVKEGFEQKILPMMRQLLQGLRADSFAVQCSVDADRERVLPERVAVVLPSTPNAFDSKYRFDSYVVGSSNQFAHAACQAVAREPGHCYNPLFIFGGAGLGKTHLLKAIGYEILKHQRDLRVLFLTSESFTNELIQAIRMDKMREFREKYRNGCDVLLIDDVHFMAGKERTQEEFFYTFNFLHESRKQIVISSDRYPKDIQGLENRLQTRFEWGLVADVQPPDVETRIAILQNKAAQEHIDLPIAVAQLIATHITSNIRELEGSLHRLQAYAVLTGVSISMELAQQTLKDIAPKVKHELTADAILKLVALQFNVRTTDLRSEKRVRKLSLPRQICMYLLRKHLLMSYPEIGKFMGGKDHSTVLHGVTKIGEQLRSDPEILIATTTIEGLMR